MTIKFLIVANALPNDAEIPIYVRLVNSKYYDKKVKTNLVVRQNLWDAKREMIKHKALYDDQLRKQINEEISNIRNYIEMMFDMEKNPANLPPSWLFDCLQGYYQYKEGCLSKGNTKGLIPISKKEESDFFKIYEKFQERQEISDSRSRQYKVLKCTLQRYQLYVRSTRRSNSKYTIFLDEIDSDFLSDFYSYVESEHIYFEKYPEIFSSIGKKTAPKPRSIDF